MLLRNKTITLSQEMFAFAEAIGKGRYARSRESGIFNNRKSNLPDEFIDVNGACGEVAVNCLMFIYNAISMESFLDGIDMIRDNGIKSVASGSDLGDLILDNGQTLDIKTTHYTTGNLLITARKLRSSIDLYAGCRGDYLNTRDFEFIGYQTADYLRYNYRQGESYELFGPASLRDFSELRHNLPEKVVFELLYDPELWANPAESLSEAFREKHLAKARADMERRMQQLALFENCDWWDD